MSRRGTSALKAALAAMHYSGAAHAARPWTSGVGAIFMLHNVSPEPVRGFEPNRILRVRPDFLEDVIQNVRARGFDLISLDDVPQRLATAQVGANDVAPFACFTFDDGYRDNREYALPIFKRHGVPMAVYVPTDFADGRGDLWWLGLEAAIRRSDDVAVPVDDGLWRFTTQSVPEKYEAFHAIYWWLRSIDENRARLIVSTLVAKSGGEEECQSNERLMSWAELKAFADDPLVTIGGHTCTHRALAKLSEADARHEMSASIARLETELGHPCRHFSYPYGDEPAAGEREFRLAKELGIATAVTTRKGLIHAKHHQTLTSLPRLSLNGDYQDWRYTDVLLSGAPFALRDAWARVQEKVS